MDSVFSWAVLTFSSLILGVWFAFKCMEELYKGSKQEEEDQKKKEYKW